MTPGVVLGVALGCGLLLIFLAAGEKPGAPARTGARSRSRLPRRPPEVNPAFLVLVCLLSGAVCGTAAFAIYGLPIVGGLAAVMAGFVPAVVVRARARKRRTAEQDAWPDAIDSVISGIRAGLPLAESLASLAARGPAPLRPAFGSFAAEYRASGAFDDALTTLTDHAADPVADRVAAMLRIARDVGGSDIGAVLRNLSVILRDDARVRGEISARQSWTVSGARVAVAAPWVTLALLCTRPESALAYRATSGAVLLLITAALCVVAYRLMLVIGRLPAERRISA